MPSKCASLSCVRVVHLAKLIFSAQSDADVAALTRECPAAVTVVYLLVSLSVPSKCASLICVRVLLALNKVHLAEQLLAHVCASKECRQHSCVVYQNWKFIMRNIFPIEFHQRYLGDFKSQSHCGSTSSICRWTGTFFNIASNGFANNAKS